MVMAVNILTRTPIASVKAKPLIKLVPNQNKIIEVMIVERLLSRIDSQALQKPSRIASSRVLPEESSSFILSKIKMFASTAIPIVRMNPAIPAAVNVTQSSLKIESIRTT
jgi:hypothetical protein